MTMRRSPSHVAILAGLVLLFAVPALAGDAVITNGIDLWRTPGTGGTFVDFSRNPKALGKTDTIIQRLDDAVFTKNLTAFNPIALRSSDGIVRQIGASSFRGQEVAITRIQVKAISFASVRPVETGCGLAEVKASLAGEQPITEMIIVRDGGNGGHFYAPLALNVRLTFTPIAGGAPVEVVRNIQFPAKAFSSWTDAPGRRVAYNSFVSIDSDSDGTMDVMLPGTSNFAAGSKGSPSGGRGAIAKANYSTPYCEGTGIYHAEHCHDPNAVY